MNRFKYIMNIKGIHYLTNSLVFLLLIIYFSACKGKQSIVSTEESDSQYPTILYPLTNEQVQQLQVEFDSLNKSRICTQLDQYGFTYNDNYCRAYDGNKISADTAYWMAVDILLKNSKFTNVTENTAIVSSDYSIFTTDSIQWNIRFGPQIYNGIEVTFAWISVKVCGDAAYSISEHWYPSIYIPAVFRINENQAKERIIGEKIIWYSRAGEEEFTIIRENIGADFVKAIFPLVRDNSIELRITWKIPIIYSNIVGWHVYFDVMNGEIVSIIQEFRT